MCRTDGPPSAPATSSPLGFSKDEASRYYTVLAEEDDDDDVEFGVKAEVVRVAVSPPPQSPTRPPETSPTVEISGGALTSVLILVLNVTYAGVVMGGSVEFLPYLSHGIAMCLACTSLSNLWLLFARRNMPFITVSDSFMAVLFATTAQNIVTKAAEGTSLFGTLAVSMLLCSLILASGYIAVGSARVCNIVQFVPSPVMAGYQASIGWLLLDSAATLACAPPRPSRPPPPARPARPSRPRPPEVGGGRPGPVPCARLC